MNTWANSLKYGLVTGGIAGLASAAMLAWRGRRELGRPVAPLNAPSHWLWGDEALHRDAPTVRYTLPGLVIHQASAVMWGVLYERFISRPRRPVAVRLVDATLATAVAAAVDFVLTPKRLRPGFEQRLSLRGLVAVYGAFAVGTALGSHLAHGAGRAAEASRGDGASGVGFEAHAGHAGAKRHR